MIDPSVLSGLPIDVYSRLQSLFFHVQDIRNRATNPVYGQLVDDFEEMAVRFIDSCKMAIAADPEIEPLKLHQAVDKLLREWTVVIDLISTVDLGKSYLDQFQPFIQQAAEDIGLAGTDNQFVLVP